MVIFLMQCIYRISATRLFDEDSDISTQYGLKKARYFECWSEIKSKGLEGKFEKPFWQFVEQQCNKIFQRLYLRHLRDDMEKVVALDDDKVEFATLPDKKFPERLKVVHHAASKRMGFTCHTAASTHCGMPICIRFERDGDTTTTCYVNMVNESFGNGCGPSGVDLSGITFASDRGYWTLPLLFGYLLKQGMSFKNSILLYW
jgi:hypothetical protein